MAENFKKRKHVGPAPAATHGRPDDPKTTGTTPTTYPHSQDPKVAKHKGRSTTKEPPNTPHKTTMPEWNYKSREIRQPNPTPGLLKQHGETSDLHTMSSMSQHHSTVQGSRYPTSGGQSVRPYTGTGDIRVKGTGQEHTMAGPSRHAYHVGMTKSVRGKIGKPKKKHHVSAYP